MSWRDGGRRWSSCWGRRNQRRGHETTFVVGFFALTVVNILVIMNDWGFSQGQRQVLFSILFFFALIFYILIVVLKMRDEVGTPPEQE